MKPEISCEMFDAASHLSDILALCRAIEWDNFHYDPDLTRKSLTAPGVTTIVSVADGEVIGFAQIQGDGVGLQTLLSLLAVDEGWRRNGIARRLVEEGFRRLGAARMDLTSSDEARRFYRSLPHREQTGFRLYPPNTKQREA